APSVGCQAIPWHATLNKHEPKRGFLFPPAEKSAKFPGCCFPHFPPSVSRRRGPCQGEEFKTREIPQPAAFAFRARRAPRARETASTGTSLFPCLPVNLLCRKKIRE